MFVEKQNSIKQFFFDKFAHFLFKRLLVAAFMVITEFKTSLTFKQAQDRKSITNSSVRGFIQVNTHTFVYRQYSRELCSWFY